MRSSLRRAQEWIPALALAALISMHGDDRGLVLPPALAPVQVVIVPIMIGKRGEEVETAARDLEERLKSAGLRVRLDERDMRPGAKYYYWEMRGVPLRLEIGPRDLDACQATAVTRLGKKSAIPLDTICEGVDLRLSEFAETLRERADDHVQSRIRISDTIESVRSSVETGVAVVTWCGERECADRIEEETGADILGTGVRSPFIEPKNGRCIVCGRKGETTLVGRAY